MGKHTVANGIPGTEDHNRPDAVHLDRDSAPLRMTVVTADAALAAQIERVGADQGWTPVCFATAEEALAAQVHAPAELVVLDLDDVDGVQYCRKIKTLPGGQRTFVLVLAEADQRSELLFLSQTMADDFLLKPLDDHVLQARFHIVEKSARKFSGRHAIDSTKQLATDDYLRSLYEHTPAGCVLAQLIRNETGHPMDCRFVDINPAFERLTNLKGRNLIDHTLLEMLPEDGPRYFQNFVIPALHGECISFDTQDPRTGRYFQVTCYSPHPDYLSAVFLNTSEYKQTLDMLRESRSRLETTLDAVPDMIYELSLDGTVRYANKAAFATLGFPPEVVGKIQLTEFMIPEDAEKAFSALTRMVQDGTSLKNSRYTLLTTDKRRIPVEANAVLLERHTDAPTVLGLARDISARLEQEKERARLQEHIQKLQKVESLRVLAGGIAHDFNNLLAVVIGNAALARSTAKPESRVQTYLSRIQNAAHRAGELTDQMLAFAGKGQLTAEPVHLDRIVDETIHLMSVSLPHTVDVNISHQKNAQNAVVKADPSQIRRIILNLITNATEAMQDAQGTLTIHTGLRQMTKKQLSETCFDNGLQAGLYVYLQVEDTGCGMEPETAAKLFEPFFTTKFTGRGLGMAAVLGMVEGHKGAVDVETEKNCGTRITVYLPAKKKKKTDPPHPGIIPEPQKGLEATVLLVDDQQSVLEVAQEMLESAGFEVLAARNGVEALGMFDQHRGRISAVVLDLLMPKLDGAHTFKKLLDRKQTLPIVVSSGYTEQEAVKRFSLDGLAAYIKKPFSPENLVETIRRVLPATH